MINKLLLLLKNNYALQNDAYMARNGVQIFTMCRRANAKLGGIKPSSQDKEIAMARNKHMADCKCGKNKLYTLLCTLYIFKIANENKKRTNETKLKIMRRIH